MSETWLIKPLRQYPKSESCHLDFIENDFIENDFIENDFIENDFIENDFTENDFTENVDFIENMTHLLTT
jgi:hypothetical protein